MLCVSISGVIIQTCTSSCFHPIKAAKERGRLVRPCTHEFGSMSASLRKRL